MTSHVRPSLFAAGAVLLATLAFSASPHDGPQNGPQDAPSLACDGEVRQRAAPGPLGYVDRHDAGDPRCEGLYQRDVASDNLPEVAPMSLVLRARPFTPSDKTVIALAWPHVAAPITICARHTVDSILYRMDASKQVGDTPDQPAAECDEFRWHTGVLEQVGRAYAGFDLANLRVLAQVNVPTTGPVAERFPQAMRGKALLLPLLVNAPASPPAAQREGGGTTPAAKPVRMALAFHTNRELRDVTLRCTPVDSASGPPVERTFAAVPRGVFAVRNLELPAARSDTDFWMVELAYQFHHESNWEHDRTAFYIMAPGPECVRWAESVP